MKKYLIVLVAGLFISLNLFFIPQPRDINSPVTDGPYIFSVRNKLIAKWVDNNVLRTDTLNEANFTKIKRKFRLIFDYEDLAGNTRLKIDYRQDYRNVDSIAVLGDAHGEYDSYINLLKVNGIIDKELNWKFGAGHLVIMGDIFDRGETVTEILWHLYGLQKQASKAGGMVHLLLGNHELMVLGQDFRYINEKYRKVEEISAMRYSDLFSEKTILGEWLYSWPVMIQINDIIFVHGGISIDMVRLGMNVIKANKTFTNSIVGSTTKECAGDEYLKFLSGGRGPVWYRGYFEDLNFPECRIDSILSYYEINKIVVGHTSCEEITSLFNNKVIGVDAGISIGLPGEMLIYKYGQLYEGNHRGARKKLK